MFILMLKIILCPDFIVKQYLVWRKQILFWRYLQKSRTGLDNKHCSNLMNYTCDIIKMLKLNKSWLC
jgi:hypothetical protein